MSLHSGDRPWHNDTMPESMQMATIHSIKEQSTWNVPFCHTATTICWRTLHTCKRHFDSSLIVLSALNMWTNSQICIKPKINRKQLFFKSKQFWENMLRKLRKLKLFPQRKFWEQQLSLARFLWRELIFFYSTKQCQWKQRLSAFNLKLFTENIVQCKRGCLNNIAPQEVSNKTKSILEL